MELHTGVTKRIGQEIFTMLSTNRCISGTPGAISIKNGGINSCQNFAGGVPLDRELLSI